MPTIIPRYRPSMVFIWSSGWGPRRRRPPRGYGRRYGPPPGYGPPGYGYGRGYGRGYGPGYGPRRGYGGGGGSCLRDLLFLNAGCCLAESLGCGGGALLLAPPPLPPVPPPGTGEPGTPPAGPGIAPRPGDPRG